MIIPGQRGNRIEAAARVIQSFGQRLVLSWKCLQQIRGIGQAIQIVDELQILFGNGEQGFEGDFALKGAFFGDEENFLQAALTVALNQT